MTTTKYLGFVAVIVIVVYFLYSNGYIDSFINRQSTKPETKHTANEETDSGLEPDDVNPEEDTAAIEAKYEQTRITVTAQLVAKVSVSLKDMLTKAQSRYKNSLILPSQLRSVSREANQAVTDLVNALPVSSLSPVDCQSLHQRVLVNASSMISGIIQTYENKIKDEVEVMHTAWWSTVKQDFRDIAQDHGTASYEQINDYMHNKAETFVNGLVVAAVQQVPDTVVSNPSSLIEKQIDQVHNFVYVTFKQNEDTIIALKPSAESNKIRMQSEGSVMFASF
jgi:hypothetical protein